LKAWSSLSITPYTDLVTFPRPQDLLVNARLYADLRLADEFALA
jgi:hypothetical protein